MSRKFVYLIGAVIFLVSPSRGDCQTNAANPNPSQKNPSAQGQVQTPSNGVIGNVTPSPSAQPKTKKAHEHSEEYYQSRQAISNERVVRYSRYSFWTSLAQAVASVLGIIFIVWTLWETHKTTKALEKANVDARALHDIERRPWLSVKADDEEYVFVNPFAKVSSSKNQTYFFTFGARITNLGQSPAHDVFFHIELDIVESDDAPKELPTRFKDRQLINQWIYATVFPGEGMPMSNTVAMAQENVEAAVSKYKRPCFIVYGTVQYTSAHTKGMRQTSFAYLLRPASRSPSEPILPWHITSVEDWSKRALCIAWSWTMAD